MSSNNKISNLVDSQSPFFVRNDHRNFVRFLEAYYEYLEQTDKTLHTLKNVENYNDIDYTKDPFEEELYKQYLSLIPKDSAVDKRLLLKHVKDFYRARGTEKSIRFLLNILFGNYDDVSFYYPKRDILRASDGKWFIEKSLRFTSFSIKRTDINFPAESQSSITYDSRVLNFIGTRVTGLSSGATAIVENVDVYYRNSVLIYELKISNQLKDFVNGEKLESFYNDGDKEYSISAFLFSGSITSPEIIDSGFGYKVGDVVQVDGDGTGAIVVVSSVTAGNVTSVGVLSGGAGFVAGDDISFSSDTGSGATANVIAVLKDNSVHPNSYNIVSSVISLEKDTAIGNAKYSNLVSAITDPANNWVANSMSYFVYSNTGPISIVTLLTSGQNYATLPSVGAEANTRVRSLGILGRMEIEDGGVDYQVGDTITFTNQLGGYGTGAAAQVAEVDVNGTITKVEFVEISGFPVGGSGYAQDKLPTASVSELSGGSGANVRVSAILGDGESLKASTGSIGRILSLRITDGGSGYSNATLNLTAIGDGTAQANISVIEGVFTYPGRWLNDDGHLSGYNFLEDRDYYQPFSYVIRTTKSFNEYRKPLKELIHPAGLKVFGEHLIEDDTSDLTSAFRGTSSNNLTVFKRGTYQANLGNVVINTTGHGYSGGEEIYLEFVSGDTINISNGIFVVSGIANSDTLFIEHSNNTVNTSGNVYTGIAS
jgi:hypothetical protein